MFAASSLTSLYGRVVPWVALLLVGAVVGALVAAIIPPMGQKLRRGIMVSLFVSLPVLGLLYFSPALVEPLWRRVAEPHLQPSMRVALRGAVHGQPYQWSGTFVAKPGDRIDLLIECTNTGWGQADNAVTRIEHPAHLIALPMTAYFANSLSPDGMPATAWGDGTALFANGLNLGSYSSGAGFWVVIGAHVPKKAPAKDDGTTTTRADGLVKYVLVAFARCDRSSEALATCEIQVKY